MIYQYNDNELLYLMYERVEEAEEILFLKYSNLIYKRMKTFMIKIKNQDDFFQEGLMALNTALNTYNPFRNKSFNKYFDLILQRKFIYILNSNKNYYYNVILLDSISHIIDESIAIYEVNNSVDPVELGLNQIEIELYNLKYVMGYKYKEIANILGFNIKKVYNLYYNLKDKIKKQLS